jgi:two-component system, NarL family, invasion response regulator UvrY
MIRILLADDHNIVREGLNKVISSNSDMEVIGEASNDKEILSRVSKDQYDVIILDISMPGRNGLDIVSDLKKNYPNLAILIFSMHSERQFAIRSLKLGCSGYITKDADPNELLSAIRKVASGGRFISPAVAEEMAFALDANSEKPAHEKLSNREYQIMRMIASG